MSTGGEADGKDVLQMSEKSFTVDPNYHYYATDINLDLIKCLFPLVPTHPHDNSIKREKNLPLLYPLYGFK